MCEHEHKHVHSHEVVLSKLVGEIREKLAPETASDVKDIFLNGGYITGDLWKEALKLCDHEHEHEHSHDVPLEEAKAIKDFLFQMERSVNFIPDLREAFCRTIHKIDSPVDLYQHNERFKKALNSIDIKLRWGTKASRSYRHAYVIPFGDDQGEVYTILTNVDLSGYEKSVFPWESHDLFQEDK